ncbi:hypothetical protein J6590_072198 [Homalodisca vitripennis]|nr:hypothetical protein J6590_072198 [Homalodisca vitripennis]
MASDLRIQVCNRIRFQMLHIRGSRTDLVRRQSSAHLQQSIVNTEWMSRIKDD